MPTSTFDQPPANAVYGDPNYDNDWDREEDFYAIDGR